MQNINKKLPQTDSSVVKNSPVQAIRREKGSMIVLLRIFLLECIVWVWTKMKVSK